MDKEINLYISAWMWQIISIIFLTASLMLFAMPRNLRSATLYVACFLVFMGCQLITFRRKKLLEDE